MILTAPLIGSDTSFPELMHSSERELVTVFPPCDELPTCADSTSFFPLLWPLSLSIASWAQLPWVLNASLPLPFSVHNQKV